MLCAGRNATLPHSLDATPCVLTDLIRSNPDLYQPLREQGTSRHAVTEDLAQRTAQGHTSFQSLFFSSLLFRGLLFNGNYLTNPHLPSRLRRTIFTSLEDFLSHTDKVRPFAPELTNLHSFLISPAKRTQQSMAMNKIVLDAAVLWNAASSPIAAALCQAPNLPINFTFALSTALQLSANHGISCMDDGDITLAVFDLCYAGVVSQPSVDEVGEIVFTDGQDGVAALKLFGLLPESDVITLECTQNAFAMFYHSSTRLLLDGDEGLHAWCPILAAHCLHIVAQLERDGYLIEFADLM